MRQGRGVCPGSLIMRLLFRHVFPAAFKHLFSGFLRSRHIRSLFRRQPMLETLVRAQAGRGGQSRTGKSCTVSSHAAPDGVSRDMQRIAAEDVSAALARMVSHAQGLSWREAAVRRLHFGAVPTRSRTNSRSPGLSTCGTATKTRSTCCSRRWRRFRLPLTTWKRRSSSASWWC